MFECKIIQDIFFLQCYQHFLLGSLFFLKTPLFYFKSVLWSEVQKQLELCWSSIKLGSNTAVCISFTVQTAKRLAQLCIVHR